MISLSCQHELVCSSDSTLFLAGLNVISTLKKSMPFHVILYV